MSKKQDELLSSNYDGIQEYDNDLPRWWLYLFYFTIIYSIGYFAYYHMGPGQSQEQVLATELKEQAAKVSATAPQGTAIASEATLLALAADATTVTKGKEVFIGKCIACHGPDGQGLIGPNLTDKYWIHGAKITDIHSVVENGVPEKGMLAWKSVLSPNELNAVVAYVWTLRGTTPANPKEPQGILAE